ncbi:MAG TPA: hypothetical protein VG245_02890 [Candidatus Dormibacteraeota bacterium]|nr:hypothetical protein [Candidatus Dormibacteraeota bacterium]
MMLATTAAAGLLLTACGAVAANGPSSSASPSPSARGRGFNRGAAGELVKIDPAALTLNTTAGDVTVIYSSTTPVQKTSTGSFADIQVGKCIVAQGQKDATGAVTAVNVRLSDKVNGACLQGGPGGGGGGFPGFGGGGGAPTTPRPSLRPSPSINPNFAAARGEVTAIAGTLVTIKDSSGASSTMTVPTTVMVTKSAAVTTADLAIGDCVLATGARDASSGKVTATALSVQPAGPSGCFTGGGRFGGFGGGRGGGGGGGGGGGFGGGGGGGG